MNYAELPQRVEALEKEVERLKELIHFLAKKIPPQGGEGAFVLMCPHCGKNALSHGPADDENTKP